jgi:signal transduction histidine kinase
MKTKKNASVKAVEILIVEDSPTQAEQLKHLLAENDYDVRIAGHGKQALALLAERQPALIISDIIMPEMSGFDLCKQIKSDESAKGIPVILLTSLASSEDVLEGLACGADNFITKPYSEDYLISSIEQILANTKLQKNERVRIGVEILYAGKRRFITAGQQQMLTLLLSTYEAAVRKNQELAQTQEKFKALNERLEDLVAERTSELSAEIEERKRAEQEPARLSQELTRKNQELEQLVYAASHDLRSPLVNVQGFSRELGLSLLDLAEAAGSPRIPDEIKEKMGGIIRNDIGEAQQYITAGIAKMDTLLNGLLKVSRLGRVVLDCAPLDMNVMLAEIRDSHQFQINQAIASVEISPVPDCRGDAMQVNQVFSNLLDNALKYTRPGQPCLIIISGRREDGHSVYCVEENGPGIAPEHQELIFDLFHRLDPVASEGEGLGLTIVRRVLDRLGGKIWVESELGKGSKFYVQLPV